MRKLSLAAMFLLSLTSCADDQLALTGTITSLPEGCRITLVNDDKDRTFDSIPKYADIEATEKFTIHAALDGPTMLRLVLTKYNPAYNIQAPVASVTFMADNGKAEMSAVSFDEFLQYSNEDSAEENVKIKAGKVQAEYHEYLDFVKQEKKAFTDLMAEGGEMLMDAAYGIIPEDNDSVVMYSQQMVTLQKRIDEKKRQFIAAYPNYAVTALLVSRELNTVYQYTIEQIDSMLSLIANNSDSHRVAIAKENAETAKKHAIGLRLGNEAVTMADGQIEHLQNLLNENGLTLIDCWASWCGPCRRAVPELKKINQKYGGQLKIVSISCDRNEQDWRKAMEEENMAWQQAILSAEQSTPFMDAYNVTTIPRLILVKDGNIIVSTSSPGDIESYMASFE